MKKTAQILIISLMVLTSAAKAYAITPFSMFYMHENSISTGANTTFSDIPTGAADGIAGLDGTTSLLQWLTLGSRLSMNHSTNTLQIDLSGQPESNVTNLASDLAGKLGLPGGTASQYLDGTGSLQTSKTLLSQFSNDAGYITSSAVSSVAGRTGAVTLTSNDLTDASSLGRAVLTATSATIARSALGAGTSSFDGMYASLSGLPTTLAGYGITDGASSATTVNGHALAANVTVSKSDVGLGSVPNVDATIASNITQDSTHRFATDAEKTTWNGKISSATGLVSAGANITLTGSGTSGSPYVVSATLAPAYSSYQSIVSQTGTSAPSGSVLGSDFGGVTFAWARTGTGVYTLTASSAIFTSGKTAVVLSPSTSPINNVTAARTSSTVITFTTSQLNLLALGVGNVDALMSGTLVEVRVYP